MYPTGSPDQRPAGLPVTDMPVPSIPQGSSGSRVLHQSSGDVTGSLQSSGLGSSSLPIMEQPMPSPPGAAAANHGNAPHGQATPAGAVAGIKSVQVPPPGQISIPGQAAQTWTESNNQGFPQHYGQYGGGQAANGTHAHGQANGYGHSHGRNGGGGPYADDGSYGQQQQGQGGRGKSYHNQGYGGNGQQAQGANRANSSSNSYGGYGGGNFGAFSGQGRGQYTQHQ